MCVCVDRLLCKPLKDRIQDTTVVCGTLCHAIGMGIMGIQLVPGTF